VHVIGQHHPSVDVERVARPRGANGAAEGVDFVDKQMGVAITRLTVKKYDPPGTRWRR
jgi:hypothetical protein